MTPKHNSDVAETSHDLDTEILENQIRRLPPSDQDRLMTSIKFGYKGPLPPATEFDKYEKTLPGAAERILTFMEREQAHRHEMTTLELKAAIDDTKQGQLIASLIMIGLIVGSILLAFGGFEGLAAGFLVTSVISVVSKFIDGRKNTD